MKTKTKDSICFSPFFAAGVFVFVFFLRAEFARAGACGGAVPCACGDNVTSNYTMTQDLNCTAGGSWTSALTIGDSTTISNSPIITLNCNGFGIYGPSTTKFGIRNYTESGKPSRDNFEIINCNIHRFQKGIVVEGIGSGYTLNNITIQKNNFYLTSEESIEAKFADILTPSIFGTNNIISENDIVDVGEYYGMDLYRMGAGSKIFNNRVMVFGKGSTPSYAVSLLGAENMDIYGNYLECYKTTSQENPGGTYATDRCEADLYLAGASSVNVFDNVFAGRGFKEPPSSGNSINWCPSVTGYRGNAGAQLYKNIFADRGNMETGSPKVQKPAGCDTLCGGESCAKICKTNTDIGGNKLTIDGILGNECLQGGDSIRQTLNPDPEVDPAAVVISGAQANNIVFLCNQNPETFGKTGRFFPQSGVSDRTGILASGTKRTTVLGCVVEKYKNGIQIKNAEDALLRENWAQSYDDIVDSEQAQAARENMGYFYQVVSDAKPTGPSDPILSNYNQKIYNPYFPSYMSLGQVYIDNATSSKNYIVGPRIQGRPKRDVLYFYNWKDYYGYYTGGTDTLEFDGTGITNIGHLTFAKMQNLKVHNVSVTKGDPLSFIGISSTNPSYKEIYSNTVLGNGAEGIYIAGSVGIEVHDNTLTGNMFGVKAGYSDSLKIYKNTITTDSTYRAKPGSWAGFFEKLKNSEIGGRDAGTAGNKNTFNSHGGGLSVLHGGGGVYFRGYYENMGNLIVEDNIFGYNDVKNNFYHGLVVFDARANKFISNTISDNGVGYDTESECSDGVTNDDDSSVDTADPGCTDLTSPHSDEEEKRDFSELELYNIYVECFDGIDNDKDGSKDFGAGGDPDCKSQFDMSESVSPGFYMNNARANVIKDNTIENNSGDNLFIDSSSSPIYDPENDTFSCAADVLPLESSFNIFLGNTLNNSKAGSGVVLDVDTCTQYSGGDSSAGRVFLNFFGHFYLSQDSRDNYSTNPSSWGQLDSGLPADYFPSGYGSAPLSGGNDMSGNYLDGITLTWHGTAQGDASKAHTNDFYGNTINSNKRYGIYFNGRSAETVVWANDAVANTLEKNEAGGVFLDNVQLSRIFGNTISAGSDSDNTIFGIRLENRPGDIEDTVSYNEIGHSGVFAPLSLPYKNIIDIYSPAPPFAYETGVSLFKDRYTRVASNEIKNYREFGIRGYASQNIVADANKISEGEAGSVGIYISSAGQDVSSGWTIQKNEIFDIAGPALGNPPARYFYVGPEKAFGELNGNNFYPYPKNIAGVGKGYYNHTIPIDDANANKAGPTGDLQKIYFYNNHAGGVTLDSNFKSYHLQIVNSKNINVGPSTVPELVFSGADPVEVIYYPTGSDIGRFSNLKFQNCRGECMILYNISYADGVNSAQVPFTNITIESSARTGIKGFYVQNALFATNTIDGVNTNDANENGGLYLYNSQNNTIRANTFLYNSLDAGTDPKKRKWDVFLGGNSRGNTFLRNTFGDASANSASGAYELRPEFDDGTFAAQSPAERREDNMCYASETDSLCDPNCTEAQDTQCVAVDCTIQENCCALFAEVSYGFDPDCSPANRANNSDIALAPCNSGDDGCCLPALDGIQDPNCAYTGDPDSGIINPLEDYTCPDNSIGDCCDPTPGNGCDYDCSYGFDPDCTATANTWCNDTDTNNFEKIKVNKPNYYEATLIPPDGGGGIPNNAKFCYNPRAKFSVTSSITQRGKYRQLGLTERTNNIFRFDVSEAWFVDLFGQDLIGRIYVGSDGVKWYNGAPGYPNKISNFISGSLKLKYNNLNPNPYHPTIRLLENYRLGDLNIRPIKTAALGISSYPPDPWTAFRTAYDFVWDAMNMKVGSFTDGYRGTFRAFLEVENRKGKRGSAGADADEGTNKIQFNYDFKQPDISSWNLAVTPQQTASYPKTYKIEWTPVTSAEEPSWTTGFAHYEVWFGDDETEVKNRSNSNTSQAGPFVWDDLVPGSSTTATKRGALSYQSCLAPLNPGTNGDCYDSNLGSINCGGTFGTPPGSKCQTIVKIQDPNLANPRTYVVQGEYYTSDATIEECDDTNSSGRKDKDTNFGDLTTLKSDKVEAACTSGTLNDREQRILVKWDTSAIPSSSCTNVDSAAIHMQISNGTATSDDYNVFKVLKPWEEDSVTWIQRTAQNAWTTPGADAANDDRATVDLVSTFPTGTGYKTASFNATGLTLIKGWIDKTEPNNGVIIVYKTIDDGVEMDSSEGAEPPKLVITCAAQGITITNPKFNVCASDNFGNTRCSSVPEADPWVETRYGNIYSGVNVGDNTAEENVLPQGKCSGTFLIIAEGSINKWKAEGCEPTAQELEVPSGSKDVANYTPPLSKKLPQKSNNFVFDLSSFDYLDNSYDPDTPNYLTEVDSVLVKKYGSQKIQRITDFNNEVPNMLDGKIYTYNGNMYINTADKTFQSGSGEQNGSGLFIVNGNLNIQKNIRYNPSQQAAKLKNLSSVVWIVLGDIAISQDVQEISGAFIALGRPKSPCTVNCGEILTGPSSAYPLKVYGMLMGRSFKFERNYTSTLEGSEIIIYDGRTLANPPFGIEDFAKNLPVWKK